jgi:TonB-dependent SusC/RagA subfamily outer membrane receptor
MKIKSLLCTGIPVLMILSNQAFANGTNSGTKTLNGSFAAVFPTMFQQIRITGVVLDEQSRPLPGVGVKTSRSGRASVTDAAGKFVIEVDNASEVLSFTYIGYTTQTRTAGSGAAPLSIRMEQAAGQTLDDIVVVGYGTRRKTDLTGAVGSVKQEQLQERPAASLNQALAGRISGVQVNTNSGRPGGQTSIRVRGFSSINSSNNPLYVIDGVILPIGTQTQNSNPIDFLNPGDIASVEVLKDASSIAIYGARGANGVVIITTKKGTAAGGKITYDVDFSVPTIGPKRVEMLDAQEYINTENLAYENSQIYDPAGWAAGNYVDPRIKRLSLPLLFDASGNPLYNTDWLKESTQNKLSQNHQLGLTG